MDPGALSQVGDSGPLTIGGIAGAIAIGLASLANWWSNRNKRDASDGAAVAEDQQRRTVAASVDQAVQIQAALINDLRAQVMDLRQRFDVASDQRNQADTKVSALDRSVSQLSDQLTLAQGLNSSAQASLAAAQINIQRLTKRVSVLEDELRRNGQPVPPEVI